MTSIGILTHAFLHFSAFFAIISMGWILIETLLRRTIRGSYGEKDMGFVLLAAIAISFAVTLLLYG